MKKAYLVRHGQTRYNQEGRCQGWANSPLTMLGKQEAAWTARHLREEGIAFDHAYSSDAGRALETLQILLAGQEVPAFASAGLREMHFGDYDGKSWEEFPQDIDMATFFSSAGGETYEEAILRVFRTIAGLLAQEDNETILVVSHGAVLSGIYDALPKKPDRARPEQFGNGCVITLAADGEQYWIEDYWQPEP